MGTILLFILIILSILMGCKLFFTSWMPSLPKGLQNSDFIYYGHRGAPSIAPENTLLSFQKAIDYNMHGLELDVQLSKDNELIIYHDQYINLDEEAIAINKLSIEDIQKINVNHKLDELDSQHIPTLADVINILPQNITLNIEIKSYAWQNANVITKKVVDLTTAKSINNQIIISSFDPFIIKKIKVCNPEIATAFIWSNKSYYHYKLFSYYAKPDAFHVNINDVNSKMAKWFKNKNISMYAYTVNSQSDLDKAKKYNMKGIFTDNPDIKNV